VSGVYYMPNGQKWPFRGSNLRRRVKELLRQRRELPAFSTLLKLARTARALVNRGYHRRIAAALSPDVRERLATLLVVPAGATRSGRDQVKGRSAAAEPAAHARAPGPSRVVAWAGRRG
jgi:hypothetical protein